jgi:hypothetical protein
MHRISLLFVFIFAYHYPSISQVLQLKPQLDSISGNVNQLELDISLKLINHSSSAISGKWVRLSDLPAGWSSAICDPVSCYPESFSSFTFSMAAFDSGYFSVHFLPNHIIGTGTIQLVLFSQSDSANTAVVGTYKATAYPNSSISDASRDKITIFPSLSHSELIIEYPEGTVKKMEVFNLRGCSELAKAIPFTENRQILDISRLSRGVHLIRFTGPSNKFIQTESFQKE